MPDNAGMSSLLFVMEFGGFPLSLDSFKDAGHHVEFARSVRKALPLLKRMQPDLLVAEFNYTSQFRDRDSNLDTILIQVQSHSPHTQVIGFVESEQKDQPKEGLVVNGFDMIGPEGYGELIGASQREESIEKLKQNLEAQGEDPKEYEFYSTKRIIDFSVIV